MSMAPEDHSSFSNLEVAHTNELESWKYKVPGYSSEPIALDPHALPEAIPDGNLVTPTFQDTGINPNVFGREKKIPSPQKRRKLIIIGVIIGIAVIIGAITGGILGSRRSKHSAENPASTEEPTHNPDQPSKQIGRVLSTSRLCALNWTSGDDAGVHYRAVFWQAATHDLMASIWESETQEWTMVNLTLGGTIDAQNSYNQQFMPAKPSTPLAATVRLHPWPNFSTIALFYLSEQNTVEQINTAVITAKTGWNSCCLSGMSNKHIAAKDSQLAAFSMSCKGAQCKNEWIHASYQMATREIALLTQQDWRISRKATTPDPQMGTGLTMTSTGLQSVDDNITFVPKLYLQTPRELQQKLWYDAGPRTRVEGSRTGSDGSPLQLSSAMIPTSGDVASRSNDLLILSIASDGSQLLVNQYSNQTGNWTGSSTPTLTKAPSIFNFTAGALVASPDEPRFIGLESNGTIRSFKISQTAATQWEYEGIVFSS